MSRSETRDGVPTIAAERQIRQSGNSHVVTIPPWILAATDLGADDAVTLSLSGEGGISVEKD
jgi:antitoxin component of MazEF toxin-antitoxin module